MALAGCGKTAPAISVSEKSSIIAKVPKGCPQQTTLSVKSPEAGEAAFTTLNSFYVYHSIDWGTLYFTNYDGFDPQNPFAHEYSNKDVTAYFDLKVKDKSAIKPGIWNYRKLGEDNELSWINISTEKLAGGVFDDKAKVEVYYMGKDYICGKVTSKDAKSSLNGEFLSKVYK
jgi:hypothetical protein